MPQNAGAEKKQNCFSCGQLYPAYTGEVTHVYVDSEDMMISKCSTMEANWNAIKCLSLMNTKVLVATSCALGSHYGRVCPVSRTASWRK